jgi:hypothetical protein
MDAFWKKTFEPSKSKDAANNVVDPDETNFIENSFQGKCMLDVSNL